ncbi:MAG: hypothetical protein KF916_00910 [Microbacteriaceae bacterium]|nr:hypothetical protein [Microbacteriaceae bacterium]
MKKIVTGIAALILLLTGCAQSAESLYEDVINLCVEIDKINEPDIDINVELSREFCHLNWEEFKDDAETLSAIKADMQEYVRANKR